jgi:hypothetical protein
MSDLRFLRTLRLGLVAAATLIPAGLARAGDGDAPPASPSGNAVKPAAMQFAPPLVRIRIADDKANTDGTVVRMRPSEELIELQAANVATVETPVSSGATRLIIDAGPNRPILIAPAAGHAAAAVPAAALHQPETTQALAGDAAAPMAVTVMPAREEATPVAPVTPAAAENVVSSREEATPPTPPAQMADTKPAEAAPAPTEQPVVVAPVEHAPPAIADEQPRTPPQSVAAAMPVAVPAATTPALPPAPVQVFAPPPRPATLIAVSHRAEEHIQYGFDLATRGALHSAQAEFIQAVRIVAEGLDTESGAQVHDAALTAALRALQEAEDFAPEDAHRGSSHNLPQLIATHRTPVLKGADLGQTTPLLALQKYYAYASDQLAAAGGHEPAASLALYGWARLQGPLAATTSGGGLQDPRAIALHQAALNIDPRNYLSANEWAVLMARYGEMEAARQLLVHSLSLAQRSETWHNLSVVLGNLGRASESRDAAARAEKLSASERSNQQSQNGMIYWVDTTAFSQSADTPAIAGSAPAAPKAAAAPAAKTAQTTNKPAGNPLAGLLTSIFRGKSSGNDAGAVTVANSSNEKDMTR